MKRILFLLFIGGFANAQENKEVLFQDIFWSKSSTEVLFGNDSVHLTFNLKDGSWTGLSRSSGSFNIMRVKTVPDFRINGTWMFQPQGEWPLDDFFVSLHPYRKEVTLTFVWNVDLSFKFEAHYTLRPSVSEVQRSVSLRRIDRKPLDVNRLEAFRFELPQLAVGESSDCSITVPGSFIGKKFTSSIPYDSLRSTPPQYFASAPDEGFGLILLENKKLRQTVATWMSTYGETSYLPYIKGNGYTILASHDNLRSYNLLPGEKVDSDRQIIYLCKDAKEALRHYRNSEYGTNAIKKENRNTAILSLDPGRFTNGFNGITSRLNVFKELGFNVLRLQPHWKGSYSPSDPFEIAPGLGSNTDLLKLVKTAHSLGFKVLFTMSVYGFEKDSGIVKTSPQMLYPDRSATDKGVAADWASNSYREYLKKLVNHDLQQYSI
jgi:hypothetical protein